jgi:hypothetical protein
MVAGGCRGGRIQPSGGGDGVPEEQAIQQSCGVRACKINPGREMLRLHFIINNLLLVIFDD